MFGVFLRIKKGARGQSSRWDSISGRQQSLLPSCNCHTVASLKKKLKMAQSFVLTPPCPSTRRPCLLAPGEPVVTCSNCESHRSPCAAASPTEGASRAGLRRPGAWGRTQTPVGAPTLPQCSSPPSSGRSRSCGRSQLAAQPQQLRSVPPPTDSGCGGWS